MDVASIMVAYTIGIRQSNFVLGVGYAFFDAIIVVWMRKPFSRAVRRALGVRIGRAIPSDRYIADIP